MLDDDPDDGEDEDNDRAGAGAVAVGGGQCLPALLLAVERRRVAQSEVELSPSSLAQSGLRPRSRQTGHTTYALLPNLPPSSANQPKTTPPVSCT